ncbi:hypothetical protein BZA05DRAFT_435681 [Tricharina praecox]|uniref:uncharacterized protein n=1 Tax=Tricharina praecox TaxID=43433 RepID=UPI00221FC280|nr:uncharacterized protein BZA05DRAFT_435681 [Tricharina praecox]KAI5854011.1 hypothetical protein BZA05DRAFT_435681 [Tricharina praecox]
MSRVQPVATVALTAHTACAQRLAMHLSLHNIRVITASTASTSSSALADMASGVPIQTLSSTVDLLNTADVVLSLAEDPLHAANEIVYSATYAANRGVFYVDLSPTTPEVARRIADVFGGVALAGVPSGPGAEALNAHVARALNVRAVGDGVGMASAVREAMEVAREGIRRGLEGAEKEGDAVRRVVVEELRMMVAAEERIDMEDFIME